MSQLCQAGCVRVSSELMSRCVCSEMRQCALRLISMYDLALCVEVLCASEWSTSLKLVDQPGASWRKFRCKMPSATFATCISITYFTNQGNSHVLHNQNQTNVTIMRRETSLTAWQSTSKIEPLIGTCSRKQNFPCDDQICIDNIVIESKTSGLNLKKKNAQKILRYNPLRYHKSARHVLENNIHRGWIEIPVAF